VLALILRFLGGVGLAGVHMPGLNLLIGSGRPLRSGTSRRHLHVELRRG
jgi:hypothetical protein